MSRASWPNCADLVGDVDADVMHPAMETSRHRAWVLCDKSQVQEIKHQLDVRGLLSREAKVTKDDDYGSMIVPTPVIAPQPQSHQSDSNELELERENDHTTTLREALRSFIITSQASGIDIKLVYRPDCATVSRPTVKVDRNPLLSAILSWVSRHETTLKAAGEQNPSKLQAASPKRWSVYHPMVLLPAGSFQDPLWTKVLANVDMGVSAELWTEILTAVTKEGGHKPLTHLAVNAGIPLRSATDAGTDGERLDHENILRSPSGLQILHGDFGPAVVDEAVTQADFDAGCWVEVTQNGIHQTWAPRWTMFSRGNVSEKARLLKFHSSPAVSDGRHVSGSKDLAQVILRRRQAATVRNCVAVDLYAGIGYFTFCYAKLGMKVLCWEINPWSVEGLRRGAQQNGWRTTIVDGDASQAVFQGDENITVFRQGNESAVETLRELRGGRTTAPLGPIRHVNCGFLPTSELSWPTAWAMVDKQSGAWLHLHENVAVRDVACRRQQIQELLQGWAAGSSTVEVEHVELVKTYAPGIWHCVFDVFVGPVEPEHGA